MTESDNERERRRVELHQLLATLRRRWKFVVAVLLTGIIAGVAASVLMPKTYESTVRVFFSGGANSGPDQYSVGIYIANRAKSYAEIAQDGNVVNKVIDRAHVKTTADDLMSRTTVEVPQDTVVLRIAVDDTNPDTARRLADAYADQVSDTVADLEKPAVASKKSHVTSAVTARPEGKATVSNEPVSPNIPLNVGVGAILGLVFGVGGAVVREIMSQDTQQPRTRRKWQSLSEPGANGNPRDDQSPHSGQVHGELPTQKASSR